VNRDRFMGSSLDAPFCQILYFWVASPRGKLTPRVENPGVRQDEEGGGDAPAL